MNDKEKIIRKIIRKESLRMIKESQASFLNEIEATAEIKHSMEDVNDVISLFEKKLEKLNNEEASSKDKEEYSDLKRIKQEQMDALSKVIRGYKNKVGLLEVQKNELQDELLNIQSKGVNIFKNQEINEFNNDTFKKGWGLRLETPNFNIDLVKIGDHNAYKVMATNINSINPGDLFMLPELTMGGNGNIQVYRKIGNKTEKIGEFELQNITRMVKNPQ